MSAREELLMTMLNCGSMDLAMLDDVRYDFDEIIERLDGEPIQNVGLNGLMKAVVEVGIIIIQESVDERIQALEDQGGLDDYEFVELEELKKLCPDDDIRSFHNYLDTHVWFEKSGDIYRKYLPEALDEFEGNTGFGIR